MRSFFYSFFALFTLQLTAQENLPYHQIPEAPASYTAGGVASRTIDGLGYRYYWATLGLTDHDLQYRISEDSRTAGETIDHIYGLTLTILNTAAHQPNGPRDEVEMTFSEKRSKTLENIKKASDLFRAMNEDQVGKSEIIFQRGEKTSAFPFWTLLNGPLADAIYHVGQIVTYRRASGNPMHPGVSVFSGKTRE